MTGPLDERRLDAATEAVRSQAGWCPALASLPTYELRTLLSIALRAYRQAETPASRTVPEDARPKPATPKRPAARCPKGPARTPPKRERVLERDKRVCYLCELLIAKGDESIDHVVAKARGGGSEMDNLKAAHKRCNRRKGCLSLEEYRKKWPLKPRNS